MKDRALKKYILCLPILIKLCSSARVSANEKNSGKVILNIAVVGAGPAGLVSTKHSIEQGHNVTVFEQNEELGGLWVYTDAIGENKYGVNIHSAMYYDLRANGPVQLTEFPDHYFPNNTTPFPSRIDVLKYIQSYAERYDLEKHILYNHLVVRVHPVENEKWEIIVRDLPNNRFKTQIYDAVFVCNGKYFAPKYPNISGLNEFEGKILHSHDFRLTEDFRGENVLLIGAGVSGMDLLSHLIYVADRVTLSRRNKIDETQEKLENFRNSLPPKTILKGVVQRITSDGAEFMDGTRENFSAIIFATGYQNSFPFLSVDSGIHVDDNYVQPLYKHIININHPTMAIIGIPHSSLSYYLYDFEVRFALKFFSGSKKLPPKDEVFQELKTAENHLKKGLSKSKIHSIVFKQKEYFKQLSSIAGIQCVPEVLDDLALDAVNDLITKPNDFRKYRFTIFNNNTYVKERHED